MKHHTSLLKVASLVGCEDCVHLLLKAGIAVDSDRLTLFVAAQGRHDKCSKLLLEAGANVNFQYAFNYTLLMVASSHKTNTSVNLLIQAGADVNTRNVYLQTPLFHALHHGALECLETLIQAGANVNVQCFTGETPSIVAVNFGYDKCLEVLVNAGANVNLRSWGGYTALMKVSEFSHTACVDILPGAGADINMCSIPEGLTALQFARDSCCTKSLLDAGADVNEPSPYGGTALIRAVCDGNTDSMKVLIKAGADVNATMCYRGETLCYGVTALHHSNILTRNILSLKLLLLAGAKVNMVHSKSGNALECCVYNPADKNEEQIKLLVAAGEKIQSDESMKAVQDCGFMEPPKEPSLMNITRCAIREHLLELDPHGNLFARVPRLGLPTALQRYLLYDQKTR